MKPRSFSRFSSATTSAALRPKSCSICVMCLSFFSSSKFRYSSEIRYAASANIVIIHSSSIMTFDPFVTNRSTRYSTSTMIMPQRPLCIRR